MRNIGGMILAGCLLLPSLASCSSVTPHENFRGHMSHNVGKSIDDPNTNWVIPKYLIDSKTLPNGNIENGYRFRGTCRYFFEFDPNTRRIVGWRFEGSEGDCIINP